MSDINTVELRQLVAICNMVREVGGQPPTTAYIDGLLDERRKLARVSQFSVTGTPASVPAAPSSVRPPAVPFPAPSR